MPKSSKSTTRRSPSTKPDVDQQAAPVVLAQQGDETTDSKKGRGPRHLVDDASLAAAAAAVVQWKVREGAFPFKKAMALVERDLLQKWDPNPWKQSLDEKGEWFAGPLKDSPYAITYLQIIARDFVQHTFHGANRIEEAEVDGVKEVYNTNRFARVAEAIVTRSRLDETKDFAFRPFKSARFQFDIIAYNEPRKVKARRELGQAHNQLKTERFVQLAMLAVCLSGMLVGDSTPGVTMTNVGSAPRSTLLESFCSGKTTALLTRWSLAKKEIRAIKRLRNHLKGTLDLLAFLDIHQQQAFLDSGWNSLMELFAATRPSEYAQKGIIFVPADDTDAEHRGTATPREIKDWTVELAKVLRSSTLSQFSRKAPEQIDGSLSWHKPPDEPPIVARADRKQTHASLFAVIDAAANPTTAILKGLEYTVDKVVNENKSDLEQRKQFRSVAIDVLTCLLLAELHKCGVSQKVLKNSLCITTMFAMASEFFGEKGVDICRFTKAEKGKQAKAAFNAKEAARKRRADNEKRDGAANKHDPEQEKGAAVVANTSSANTRKESAELFSLRGEDAAWIRKVVDQFNVATSGAANT